MTAAWICLMTLLALLRFVLLGQENLIGSPQPRPPIMTTALQVVSPMGGAQAAGGSWESKKIWALSLRRKRPEKMQRLSLSVEGA